MAAILTFCWGAKLFIDNLIDREYRLVLFGELGVGKTTIYNKITDSHNKADDNLRTSTLRPA